MISLGIPGTLSRSPTVIPAELSSVVSVRGCSRNFSMNSYMDLFRNFLRILESFLRFFIEFLQGSIKGFLKELLPGIATDISKVKIPQEFSMEFLTKLSRYVRKKIFIGSPGFFPKMFL